jgi:hypothetical protein
MGTTFFEFAGTALPGATGRLAQPFDQHKTQAVEVFSLPTAADFSGRGEDAFIRGPFYDTNFEHIQSLHALNYLNY